MFTQLVKEVSRDKRVHEETDTDNGQCVNAEEG